MGKFSFWRNFLRGIRSLFDWNFGCQSYKEHFGKDEELLASDWRKTGDDIRYAIGQIDYHFEKGG